MNEILNHEQQKIAEWLSKVRFRRKLFGGVSQQDVWRKIEQLNEMYEAALSAERARYDALLEQQRRNSSFEAKALDPEQEGEESGYG